MIHAISYENLSKFGKVTAKILSVPFFRTQYISFAYLLNDYSLKYYLLLLQEGVTLAWSAMAVLNLGPVLFFSTWAWKSASVNTLLDCHVAVVIDSSLNSSNGWQFSVCMALCSVGT